MSVAPCLSAMAHADQHPDQVFCCVVCGRRKAANRPVLTADPPRRPFDLVRCSACGLVQQYPRYTTEQFIRLYDRDYYVFAEDEPSGWSRAVQQYVIHVLPWETGRYRRLLEVGCGTGHFSALADRRGWRVVGIDVSPEAVSQARHRFALDFRAGSLARHREALPPFDLVFLGDVIEHVASPVELLADVRRVLSPDGVLCIDTPNWGSRWRRWGRGRWLGLNRFHVNLFDNGSLTHLLETCRFGEIKTGGYTHYRYESWADRPEVQAVLSRMPEWLAWRINRFFERRAAKAPWASLRHGPPDTLERALGCLGGLAAVADSPAAWHEGGDNLVAVAKPVSVTPTRCNS